VKPEHIELLAAMRGNVARLSARELEVLRLMGQGFAVNEIAARLHITAHTIYTHTKRATVKLGARNTKDAANRLFRFEALSEIGAAS
jgi:DNA-binding CsgD family transcriptional regulator